VYHTLLKLGFFFSPLWDTDVNICNKAEDNKLPAWFFKLYTACFKEEVLWSSRQKRKLKLYLLEHQCQWVGANQLTSFLRRNVNKPRLLQCLLFTARKKDRSSLTCLLWAIIATTTTVDVMQGTDTSCDLEQVLALFSKAEVIIITLC